MAENRKKADKKWRRNNKEHVRYLRYRTTARTFARHYATREDIEELIQIFEDENPENNQEKG